MFRLHDPRNKLGMKACKTCVYFEPLEEQEFGSCKRNPPMFVMPRVLNGHWPVVAEDDWCGEHTSVTNDSHLPHQPDSPVSG